KLRLDRLTNLQKPALTVPLKLTATAVLAGRHVDVTLDSETLTPTPAKLQVKGGHDLSTGTGSATVALSSPAFKKGGLQPADLSPAFGGLVSGLEGTAALAGTLRWTARTITPDLTVTLKAARSTSSLALTGTLSLAGQAIEGSAISVTVTAPDAGLRNPAVARVKKLSVQPQAAGGQRIV